MARLFGGSAKKLCRSFWCPFWSEALDGVPLLHLAHFRSLPGRQRAHAAKVIEAAAGEHDLGGFLLGKWPTRGLMRKTHSFVGQNDLMESPLLKVNNF